MKSFALQTACVFCLVYTACLIASPLTMPLIKEPDPCSPYEFKCKNGQCLSQYNVCDSNKDCPDGEDENLTMCLARPCLPDYPIRCMYNGICIPMSWICDGNNDCGDNGDEVKMTCLDLMRNGAPVNYTNPYEIQRVDMHDNTYDE